MNKNLTPGIFQKVHFIRIIDFNYTNAGDIFSSPLMYTYDFFKDYSVITHNISTIRYSQISKNDVVIIGGGGLLNYNPWFNFNVAINRVLDLCDNVILWGAGFNSTYNKGEIPDYSPLIDFTRFKLYGIRDFGYESEKYNYVPCASSMNPLLQQAYDTIPTEKVGTILRTDDMRNEDKLRLEGIPNISHYNNITSVMDFIAKYEYIVTTSYHGALWATLANRKVIVPSSMKFGFKYNFYPYPPLFVNDITNEEQLQKAMDEVVSYPEALSDCRTKSYEFYDKVKEIVKEVIPVPDKSYEYFYNQNLTAENFFKLTRK